LEGTEPPVKVADGGERTEVGAKAEAEAEAEREADESAIHNHFIL
jgi:hypothetical protein